MQPAGRSNGMYFDSKGNLITCADEKNELWSISPEKKVTVLIDNYKGKLLNAPNDLWIHPQTGNIYFTDPFYKRKYWERGPKEQDVEGVYLFSPQTGFLQRIANDLEQPNGIIGTPDGKTLYVADIRAKLTYRYSIQPDGTISGKNLFCEMGSDGMTIDNEGNVYLTGNGVTVFDRNGGKIEHIAVNERWTANVCFGGKGFKTLFITAMDSLYSIEMKTTGVQ
jgi:gluconolactonase